MFRSLGSRLHVLAAPGLRGPLTQSRRALPVCRLDTNLERRKLPADFHNRLCELVAQTLGKDQQLVNVLVNPDQIQTAGGQDQSTATLHIWSIGVFDADRNPRYSRDIFEFLVPKLGIPADRISVLFHPIEKEAAGHLLYRGMAAARGPAH